MAKGTWANKLGNALWSYQTTHQSTTSKTPFKLTYIVDTMIPMEVKEPSPTVTFHTTNSQALWE